MATTSATVSPATAKGYRAILWGGLAAGILDLAAAFVSSAFQGRSPVWVLQAIASGLLGANSYQRGFQSATLGLAIHFLIAFVATIIYYVASRKLVFLRRQTIISGLLYGVAVYAFMNLVVLRLAFPTRATPALTAILTGLVIHMLCVGLPIAVAVRRYAP